MATKANRAGALGLTVLLVTSLLAGCGQAVQAPEQPRSIDNMTAQARTEVPLTRTLHLDHAGEVVNLEFDLPAAGLNASSDLLLGLRLASRDPGAAMLVSDSLIRAGLAAKLHLTRMEDGKAMPVDLVRNSPDLRERLAVSADGAIPGVTAAGVDDSALHDAGLIDPSTSYDVLMLALANDVLPGHYRLSIELSKPHPQFHGEDIQLLIAYLKSGK